MTSSEEKSLRARVVKTLLSEACSPINFSIDGTTIAGLCYKTCAQAVAAGKIGIELRDLPKGEGARYSASYNKFIFPNALYGQDEWERMSIVHESTHLWIDISKKNALAVVNEMCAFIAGAVFYKTLGKTYDNDDGSTFLAAQIVAGHVLSKTDLNIMPASSDVNNLRYAIWQQPIYSYLNQHRNYDYGEDGI